MIENNEPDRPNEEFIKSLKCDCCGAEIINLKWVECVINPYETLCMSCFRGDYKDNAKVLKENANNYRLQRELEHERANHQDSLNQAYDMSYNLQKLKEETEEYIKIVNDYIQEGFELALKTDSASAIDILRELKEKIGKEDLND